MKIWLKLEAKFGDDTLAEGLIGRISWSNDLVVQGARWLKTDGWLQGQLHSSEVDQMSTWNSQGLSGKKEKLQT